MSRPPCPACSGPSRETVDMVCQTCGTSFRNTLEVPYPRLDGGVQLHVCLTCGAALPVKGIAFHEDWHRNIAAAAIDALGR